MFDRYIAVDWSASNRPTTGKDSIWLCDMPSTGQARTRDLPTRLAAEAVVRELLIGAVGRGERVLVGFDFPYGFPAGFASALGLPGAQWRAVWDLLVSKVADDRQTNANNRFSVASMINAALPQPVFWGRPPSMTHVSALSPMKDRVSYQVPGGPAGLEEWRVVEQVLRGQGTHPQPVWKLLGVGSVGSQAITGIPVISRLRDDPHLREVSRVWPFEVAAPDLPAGLPAVIHAEIWPSLTSFVVASGQVKDEAQVLAQAEEYRSRDREGALLELFAAARTPTAREEGWILGVV